MELTDKHSLSDHYQTLVLGRVKIVRQFLRDAHYPTKERDMSSEREGYSFYQQTGPQARLSNSCRTAERHLARVEFQNAVVMSSGPLEDGRAFQVLIERKVSTWSGSVIIGEENPPFMFVPYRWELLKGKGRECGGGGMGKRYLNFAMNYVCPDCKYIEI